MPRKELIRTDRFPYHVTARTNNRELFHLPLEQVWKILGSECWITQLLYGVEFHAIVLMPNHIHMILTTPNEDLGVVMTILMKELTKRINVASGRSGRVFGGPYFWTLIRSTQYFRHVIKYVYRNPVKAKLVDRVEQYPYSTLSGLVGNTPLLHPIHFTRVALELGLPTTEPVEMLDWLNKPFPAEAEAAIRHGLSRTVFDNIKCRDTRRPYAILEQEL